MKLMRQNQFKKPSRSAKAKGLTTQSDKRKSGDKKSTLKTASILKIEKSRKNNFKL